MKEEVQPSSPPKPSQKEGEIVSLNQQFKDEYSLAEMPTKEDLEDFLRCLSGKKTLGGRRPIYNLITHRFER